MSKTNYGEAALLNAVCNNTAFAVAVPWVALHSADPTETGAVGELSGGGYARVNSSLCWPVATDGSLANDAAITFAVASGNWIAATHFSIWDAVTAGNCLRSGTITTPRTVLSGDTASFAIGAMVLTED